jgi:hypothetical protein
LNQFADLSVCANQNNFHKNSILVSDLRIYLFRLNTFLFLTTGELISFLSFSVMFCIDWYINPRWTKLCQMVYLPIGMQSETAAQPGRPRAFDPFSDLGQIVRTTLPKGRPSIK